MDTRPAARTPPLLIALPKQSLEHSPAPLEGASKILQQNGGLLRDSAEPHERSPLPVLELSPPPPLPPQIIRNNGDYHGNAENIESGDEAPSLDISSSYRNNVEPPSSLIGIDPESPTIVSSPTGFLTLSTGLSPTKDPSRESCVSTSPGPSFYPPSTYNHTPFVMAPMHAGSTPSSATVGTPRFSPFSQSTFEYPTQPFFATTGPTTSPGHSSEVVLEQNAPGLGQVELHRRSEENIQAGANARTIAGTSDVLAAMNNTSSETTRVTAPTETQTSSSLSKLSGLTQSELARIILRQSPVATKKAAQTAMPTSPQQEQPAISLLKDRETRNGRLLVGDSSQFPAIVGPSSWRGRYAGGCYGTSDESSRKSSGSSVEGGSDSSEDENEEEGGKNGRTAKGGKRPIRRMSGSRGKGESCLP